MFKKLRIRFITIAMLSVLLVLGAIMAAINITNYKSTMRTADKILELLAMNEGKFPIGGMNDQEMPPRDMSEMPSDMQNSEPPVMPNDTAGFGSPELEYETRFFSVLIAEDGSISDVDTGMIAAVDEDTAKEYALEIYENGKVHGFKSVYRYLRSEEDTGTRIIFYDCTRDLNSYKTFLGISLVMSAAGLAIVFVLIFFASGKIVEPIAASYEKQKRFITDAGHEIKTPLAIINADCDVILSDGENTWAEDIKAQTKRLTELTQNLIYLAKMEEGSPSINLTETDLSKITEETCDSFASMFITNNKTLTRDIEGGIKLHLDAKAITEVVVILLDNALKYSPEKGATSISLKSNKKGAILSVTNDTVNPMSKEDAMHLTDRFYRTDKSRNSSTGGYGIGLSIAHAVTAAHQGKINITPEGNTLTISILLPER
ncbi:MAG: HAMP domain-containing histidine kinase [Saccharofermentans sp.]|nr:HAMP domain-containing histidine kinase [Saccharofermentans sp.]